MECVDESLWCKGLRRVKEVSLRAEVLGGFKKSVCNLHC